MMSANALKIAKLERENNQLRKMLLATTEAIENQKDLESEHPALRAHGAVAVKARKLIDKLAA